MKIRTQFIMTMFLFGIVLAAISASAIITNQKVDNAYKQQEIAVGIAQGASELSYLSSDYVIYRESYQLERWQTRFASFSRDVAKLQTDQRERLSLIRKINTNALRLKDVFNGIVAGIGSSTRNRNGSVDLKLLQVSWSRMAVQSQELASDADRLLLQLANQANRFQRTHTVIVVVLIGVFLVYFLLNYVLTQKRVLKGIARLQAGTAVIGSGNLDFSFEENRADEIGELSRAFNSMTIDLKSVTASKAELEKEVKERRRTADALVASERKYRELLETANSIIVRWDNVGVIQFINDYGLRFFGYSSGELIGRSVTTIVPQAKGSSGRDFEAIVKDIAENPEQHTYVSSKNIRKDGKTVWVAWANKAIFDEQGKVQEIMAIGNDITRLKETEAELIKSEHEKSLILDNTYEIIAYHDVDHNLIWANAAYLKTTHLPLSDLKGKKCYACWKLDKLCYNCPVTKAIETGKPQFAELSPENQPHWPADQGAWHVGAAPVTDNAGNIIGAIEVAFDITERKCAEDTIRTQLAEKEVLLTEIHHRVKNNMQIISSLVSLQADQSEDSTIREILQEVAHRVRSMAIVHEKLYQSTDLAHIDFAEYANSLLNYLWRSFDSGLSDIRLTTDLESLLIAVNEAVPFGLILNELVCNALKHAFPDGGKGEVSVYLHNGKQGEAVLSVSDNGRGLPAGFDLSQARSLGLHLVQMLAGQLHAAVEVSSDEGTEFKVIYKRPL